MSDWLSVELVENRRWLIGQPRGARAPAGLATCHLPSVAPRFDKVLGTFPQLPVTGESRFLSEVTTAQAMKQK